jgi:hypothetical protein
MKKLYRFQTRVGWFFIAERNGRFCAVFGNEPLDCYATLQQALDDLAGGHTHWPSMGVDPASLDISDDLSDWEPVTAQ